MAGSFNHIVNGDGTFTMQHIENLRDAREALEECHQIIAFFLHGGSREIALQRLEIACERMAFPVPALPVLQPELHGAESAFRKDAKDGE